MVIDFMHDSLSSGKTFRTFNIIDDCRREALAIEADFSLPSERVIRVLNRTIAERGKPSQLRMDNGPEFISEKLKSWARYHEISLEHIKPGKPTQNAYIERFNRTLRGDILDMYIFSDLEEVQAKITSWMWEYNNIRPHKALGGRPPRDLAAYAKEENSLL